MARTFGLVVFIFMVTAAFAAAKSSPAPVTYVSVVPATHASHASRASLTNADVIRMTKAGIRAHTIVLRIRRGPNRFDVSAQALIWLKKAGVSPAVMDAMLGPPRPPKPPISPPPLTAEGLLEKALNAFGPREELANVQSIRWRGTLVETAHATRTSFTEEHLQACPDRLSLTLGHIIGTADKLVITPDFSYQTSDNLIRAIGAESAQPYRQQISFDPACIAQHAGDYALIILGSDVKPDAAVDVLKISLGSADYTWNIDAQTGRLLSIQYQLKSGEVITREYSDYRPVGNFSLPFKWRTTEPDRTIETAVSEYQVNPPDDGSSFQRPNNLSGTWLNFRVLDTQAISHGQELGGDGGTSCQLSQAANTTAVNPLDDIDFAEGTTPSNLQMTCNSWDTTKFWPRKLDAMLVVASDGNAYILTCDEQTRWSRCAPLQAGQVFHARRTETGIAVLGVDAKGKDQEVNYSIAQSETLP